MAELHVSIAVEEIKRVFECFSHLNLKVEDSDEGSSMEVSSNLQTKKSTENAELEDDLTSTRLYVSSSPELVDETESRLQHTFSWDCCCCIFPSIFVAAAPRSPPYSYPFVTIDSSFLEDERLNYTYHDFDTMTMDYFGSNFLSFDLSKSAAESRFLLSRFDACRIGAHVPVFAVLIARFEQAVYQSYSNYLKQSMPETNVINLESPLRTEEQSFDNKSTKEKTLNYPLFLNDIHSFSQEINDLSSGLDTTSFRFCLQPFFNAFNLTERSADGHYIDAKDLVFTRLHKLISSSRETENIDFSRLDAAILNSIQRIRHSYPKGELRRVTPFRDEAYADFQSPSTGGIVAVDSTLKDEASTVAEVRDLPALHENVHESLEIGDSQLSNQMKSRKKKTKKKKVSIFSGIQNNFSIVANHILYSLES
jgi:hypothetical protein